MAKKTINLGTGELSGDGESIRSAFSKINENFTEIYAGEVLDLSKVDQHILPAVTDTYDLGSPSKQWRSLYLTGSTVYFNGVPLSVTNDGTIIVNGEVAATPGGALTWDSIVDKPTFTGSQGITATTDINGNVTVGFGGVLEVGSQTQYSFEQIVDESGPNPVYSSRLSLPFITEFLGGDISLTSWGSGLNIKTRNPDPFTDYTWSFRYDGTLIAPSTIAFGDGNRTNINQVNNNFVITTNTGPGDPYSWTFDEFGNLTLPGGAVVDTYGDGAGGSTYLWSAPGEVIAVRSMIAENNFGGGIDVRPDGSVDIIAQNTSSASWRFNENGSLTFPNLTTQTTAWTGSVSSLVNGNNIVSLGSDGTLTTPAGLSIAKQNNGSNVHIGSTIQVDLDKNLEIKAIGTGYSTFGWQNLDNDLNFITLNYNQSKNILITTGNASVQNGTYNWEFGSNGNLTLPNNSVLAVDGTNVEVRNVTNFNVEATGVVNVYTDSGFAGHQWQFGDNGNLQLPVGGDIVDSNGNSVLGGNANTGDITFDGVKIIGNTAPGVPFNAIGLVPDNRTVEGYNFVDNGQFLVVYPTTGFNGDTPHIHIAAGTGPNGSGDLILGDDNLNVEINHQGYVTIKSYDPLRNNNHYWTFSGENGTLFGPGMGTVIVAGLAGAPGSDLYLTPGGVDRFTSDIQFADADGTSKSVYTVDTNTFYIGNIPPIGGASLWYQNGSAVAITSIIIGSGTATFNLGDPVTLAAGTSYTVEWPGTNTYDVRVQTDSGDWRFKNDGSFSNRGSFTRTTTPGINSLETSAVVWTGLFDYISGAKLTIQLETDEVGDATGWHSQMCEAIIASRGYANSAGGALGDPIMTVYGVTYTSTVPLATFTVQRNPTTKLIEVVATRTAATTDSIAFRIYSVETATRD